MTVSSQSSAIISSRWTRAVGVVWALSQCWATVTDGGPALRQRPRYKISQPGVLRKSQKFTVRYIPARTTIMEMKSSPDEIIPVILTQTPCPTSGIPVVIYLILITIIKFSVTFTFLFSSYWHVMIMQHRAYETTNSTTIAQHRTKSIS